MDKLIGKPKVQQREYETDIFDADYQKLYRVEIRGKDGWELCGVSNPPNCNEAIYIFKRPLP